MVGYGLTACMFMPFGPPACRSAGMLAGRDGSRDPPRRPTWGSDEDGNDDGNDDDGNDDDGKGNEHPDTDHPRCPRAQG